jgi:hypothetical protein
MAKATRHRPNSANKSVCTMGERKKVVANKWAFIFLTIHPIFKSYKA